MVISDVEKDFLGFLHITSPNFEETDLSKVRLNDDRYSEIPYCVALTREGIEYNCWMNPNCSVYIGQDCVIVKQRTRTYTLKTLKKEDVTSIVTFKDEILGEQTWTIEFEQKKSEDDFLTITIKGIRPAAEFRRDIICSINGIRTATSNYCDAEPDLSKAIVFPNTADFSLCFPYFEGPGILIRSLDKKLYEGAVELLANKDDQDAIDPETMNKGNV